MTQLEKLYQSIQNLKELGVQLPEKLIDETNRIEEEIIKNEIIPTLEEAINPVIKQIQRELVLVVEYIPDEPLNVKLTKKRSFKIPQEFDNRPIPTSEDSNSETFTIPYHNKTKKTNLVVKFPDGKIISNKYAYKTLIETVKLIGIEKVRSLGINIYGVPLISNKKNNKYQQHNLTRDILIITHSSTEVKKQQLYEISRKLKLNLTIEIK